MPSQVGAGRNTGPCYIINISMVYFISGHRNITWEEFSRFYIPDILQAIAEDSSFVVGDCAGVDMLAQHFLKENGVTNVTVYHISSSPMFNSGFKTKGGFRSDVERDYTMTLESDDDILWIRPGCERSGTGNNLDRRKLQKAGELSWQNINQIESNRFL